jgi:DNA topoisomerase-2
MANEFPGTNNIPLLYRDGQFGTRLDGGADAASARYIFTKMDMLTEYIFRSEDTPILKQVNDDGDLVQPEHYVPIIPMILVNGCLGIATGWSSSIPCYNPMDLSNAIKAWLKNTPTSKLEPTKVPDGGWECVESPFEEIKPWYRGFTGTIRRDNDGKWITTGTIKREKKKNELEIVELPIGLWTNKFKDLLEDLLQAKHIKTLKNYSTPTHVKFHIKEDEQGLLCNTKNLKLTSTLHTSNMVLFDENEQIHRYRTVDEIIDAFCRVRFLHYTKRKEHQMKCLEKHIKHLSNKMKFVESVISKKLDIMNVDEETIEKDMEKIGLTRESESFDYLLRMQVRTFTREKVDSMKTELEANRKSLTELEGKTEADLWIRELNEFEKQYVKFEKNV